ncbi:cysteine-rich secreted protein, partial [Moniliophthora roreri]
MVQLQIHTNIWWIFLGIHVPERTLKSSRLSALATVNPSKMILASPPAQIASCFRSQIYLTLHSSSPGLFISSLDLLRQFRRTPACQLASSPSPTNLAWLLFSRGTVKTSP